MLGAGRPAGDEPGRAAVPIASLAKVMTACIARMLATGVAGSEGAFVAEMSAQARALGMDQTIYTDPSGFAPGTVSTVADQPRVFERAMRFTTFRQTVSMASVTLPVAGAVSNFNPLIAEGHAGKTRATPARPGLVAKDETLTAVAPDAPRSRSHPRTALTSTPPTTRGRTHE